MAKARSIGGTSGGRPRRRRHKRSVFSDWLESDACSMSVAELAEAAECSTVSIYGLRAGDFRPGLRLALALARISDGAVPADSWV